MLQIETSKMTTTTKIDDAILAKLKQIDALSRYLQKHHPTNMLMPMGSDKTPMFAHKGNVWTWPKWLDFRKKDPTHTEYAIILQSICVLDFDKADLIPTFEEKFPELKSAPMETTKHGAHFFFLRSELADSEGYFDGARQTKVDGVSVEVDFKSRTSTGTGGIIAVTPSGVRTWIRPLYATPLEIISDSLLMAVASPKKRKTQAHAVANDEVHENEEANEAHENEEVCIYPLETLTRVVLNLGIQRAIDYNTWFAVVFAISNVSRENHYIVEGRKLAHTFSMHGGTTKYLAASVDAKFDEAMAGRSHVRLGMGSLMRWLGEDLGEDNSFFLFIKSECGKQSEQHQSALQQQCVELVEKDVALAVPEMFRVLGISHVNAESREYIKDGDILRINCVASRDGAQPQPVCVELHTKELLLMVNGENAGYLHKEIGIPVIYSLGAVHAKFDGEMKWITTRPSLGVVQYYCSDIKAMIKASNVDLPMEKRSAQITIPNCIPLVRTKMADMKHLQAAYDGAVLNALTSRLGLGSIFINNVVFVSAPVETVDKRRSDHMLATAFLAGAPNLSKRLVFSPEVTSGACNGMYYCDPLTNIWARQHNLEINELITLEFSKNTTLIPAEQFYIQSGKGQDVMRLIVAGKLADKKFGDKVDSNLDIFACLNGVFDSSKKGTPPFFRKTRIEDNVQTTTGWAYDAHASKKYRDDALAFFEKVLPFPDERRVVLTYMAHLLSGRRTEKKFLVLTDRRSGHNGKSSIAKLMLVFFGDLAMRNTSFVCKGTFDKDKSSHDAALGPTRGKRLLIADELKHTMTLDVGMFKEKAGGCSRASGRVFNSEKQYSYDWQAGFVLIFNENDCPKIDVADDSFVGRIIVAPMRSKFVDEIGDEPYTYLLNSDLDDSFINWCSSIVDILLEPQHQQLILLRNVPASMSQWRQDVTQGANPVADWIDKRVLHTGNKLDYILNTTVLEWKEIFPATHEFKSSNQFKTLAKAHLISKGAIFKDQATISGKHLHACFRGVKVDDDDDDDDT